ncbi:DUF3223 domain-containing protein [Parvularcula flava]|uniref:DUF3223 domain-containing protein n=1 Tax=Aquisalinus luteolus TaxID=1566827 RepID=A0A8J3A1X7_9PROT|nr:DCL family protein [Aquisalinus luteolus]NHK27925.1 DUF3223 domain-containing protein [Aquisalinus luteolus]GGH96942.1 hypothetical protein GCM10011355_16960 [Aquisalinus luteolus]
MAKGKVVKIDGVLFERKGDAMAHLRTMLNSYELEQRVSEKDQSFLLDAIRNHPESEEKIGSGIDHFFVRRADYGTRCFWIRRVDGSEERFSYKSCV